MSGVLLVQVIYLRFQTVRSLLHLLSSCNRHLPLFGLFKLLFGRKSVQHFCYTVCKIMYNSVINIF